MKIFIAGGTGRVATELIKDLLKDGHQVVAAARHPENVAEQGNPNVTAVQLDLTKPVADIADVVGQVDAIYFTAGSRGKDLLQTDAFGAVKLMQAAELKHVKRFVLLSSLFALEPEKWNVPGLSDLTDYNIAKFFADNYLISNTKLAYTILQPTNLVEKTGSGLITIDAGGPGKNAIENVAKVLADLLKFDNTIGQVIKMRDGETPIEQALKAVK